MKRTPLAIVLALSLFAGLDLAAAQEGRRPVDRPAPPARERLGQPEAPRHLGGFHRQGGPGRFGGRPGAEFGGRRAGGPDAREGARDAEREHARFGGRFQGQPGGGSGGRFGFGERRRLRQHAREFVRSLEITPEQREAARDVVRSLRPLADEVRPQAHAILEQARELARSGRREEARELLRTQMKPLLQGALERAKPAVRPLVRTLTPEQRARLEAAAAARGRAFDEERFTSWLTRRLARRASRP